MSREIQEELKEKYEGFLNNKDKYVIMDSECSGFHSEDEIIELAIIDLEGKVLYNSLLKPTKEVTPQLTDIHGITNEALVNKPSFKDEWEKINKIIEGKILITYNGDFDIEILKNSLKKYEFEVPEFTFEALMEDMNLLHKRGLPIRVLAEDELDEYKSLDDCFIILNDIIVRYTETYY